ncbi:GAF and ANTAR domain-containing protein [Pseudonocardia endophytica]|uniref:GAF domain-containing protein n=1 Tax=Pseudonocardia endophytica TaxID=401976 RepID=A0A4R1HLA8_PSEEN|nr:GAF and ANTAR domain-containing protein [Pseudonocardia endophytica]TCK21090.1 GAF domain-containing protein [Pseudonocardia endophytica]
MSGRDERVSSQAGQTSDQRVGAQLARVLDAAARDLLSRRDSGDDVVEDILQLIVAGAVASIPHVDRAGISLIEPDGTVSSRAPTDGIVAELDELQNELGEGPCRDSIRHEHRVLIEDMAAAGADQWPRFAPTAIARGVATMCSFQLFTRDDGTAGALNLYAGRAGAFDESSLDTGALFASHAALALHGAQRAAGLSEALRTRDVIGQAKGILIERFTLSEEQAFAMLVRSSQETNLKLRDVAAWLLDEAPRGRAGPPTR